MYQILILLLVSTYSVVTMAQFDYSEDSSYEPYDDYESGDELPFDNDIRSYGLKQAYIDQCIDHLYKMDSNEACKPTWKHKYWYAKNIYKRGGPLYRSIGGGESHSEFPGRGRQRQRRFGYGNGFNSVHRSITGNRFPNPQRSPSDREPFPHRPPTFSGGLFHCRRICRRLRWTWKRPLMSRDDGFCMRRCVMSICDNEWNNLMNRQSSGWGEWSSR